MPKLYYSDYEKKIAAFRKWFKGRCASEGIRQKDLAAKLGLHQVAISNKVRVKGYDQSAITYKDLLVFFDSVNATDEEILHYMRMDRR